MPEPPATSPAREAILGRIRAALSQSGDRDAEYAAIPRDYRRQGALDAGERLALFEERLRDYDSGVAQVEAGGIAQAVAETLRRRNRSRIAVPHGIPASWLPDGFCFVPADEMDAAELDTLDGVLSGCTVAIALTGSIVLQNAPAQGPRKLSLVPDYHLCIIGAEQVVETVPEALERLAATAQGKTLPTTFISGPSATADIEMTRIKGVHGPRFLDALLVMPALS